MRAPINIALAPVLVTVRLLAGLCALIRLPRAASWLAARPILLRSAVSARVETILLHELFEVPLRTNGPQDRGTRVAALCGGGPLGQALAARGEAAPDLARQILRDIGEYTSTRAAMAEVTTALFTLIAGGLVFQALTPGMISMAPGVAAAVSQNTAVANFPLGATLGGVWYGVFPVAVPPWLVALTVLGLVCLGAVVATFAGVLADPVQARLGIHRRRLNRLVDAVEGLVSAAPGRGFVAREHYIVRVFDLWDAVISALRILRG